jgi:hypothetical protein
MQKLLGYLTVLAVIAAIYAVVMFVPMYLDHFEVKDISNSTFNAYREMSSVEHFRNELLRKLNAVEWATHPEQDEFGVINEVKGLGLTAEDVFVEFDDRTKVLWVKFSYLRRIVLKPSQKVRTFRFDFERKERPVNVY